MERNITLLAHLKVTFSELEKAVLHFNETTFNQKTAGSNWSPAMVAQHLILAGTDIDKVLLGNTKATDGEANGKVEDIRNILLNLGHKMTSPAFIEPADQRYSIEAQQEKLNNIGMSIINIVPDLDLTLTCTDFEMPFLGYLTRLELISFVMFHTQRHTHQLNNMTNLL